MIEVIKDILSTILVLIWVAALYIVPLALIKLEFLALVRL